MTMPFSYRSPRAGRATASRRHDRRRRRDHDRAWTLSQRCEHERAAARPPTPRRCAASRPCKVGDLVPDTPFVDQTRRGRSASPTCAARRRAVVHLHALPGRAHVPADQRQVPPAAAAGRRAQLHLVEVTLDPTYDRPPVLARYGRTFGADPKRWSLVVGDAEPTLDFAAQFGITAFPDRKSGSSTRRTPSSSTRRPHPPA